MSLAKAKAKAKARCLSLQSSLSFVELAGGMLSNVAAGSSASRVLCHCVRMPTSYHGRGLD